MGARAICIAILSLQAAYSMALVPAAPALLDRDPVLLEALRATIPAIAAAGAFARVGEASLALALLAPLPTLVMADPFLWWAGRLWGPKVASFLGGRGRRGGRRTARAMRLLDRYGAWAIVLSRVLPVPSAMIYAAAGWNGMRLRRFLVLDWAGAMVWIVPIVALGYGIGQPAVQVAEDVTRYALVIGVGVGVVGVVVAGIRALMHRRRASRADRSVARHHPARHSLRDTSRGDRGDKPQVPEQAPNGLPDRSGLAGRPDCYASVTD